MSNRFLIFVLIILAGKANSQGVPISPIIMGQNYHFAKWTDPKNNPLNIFGSMLSYSVVGTNTVLSHGVKPSNCVLLRIGGNQYNISDHKPNSDQEVYYVSMIDEARKNGMVPVLTLPFLLDQYPKTQSEPDGHREKNYTSSEYTAAVAASVRTLQAIFIWLTLFTSGA